MVVKYCDGEYLLKRDGTVYTTYTKDQLEKIIDFKDPNTFKKFLKELDHPFLKEEWENILNKKVNRPFVRYVLLMKLKGYRGFSYNDSNYLNELRVKKKQGDKQNDTNS